MSKKYLSHILYPATLALLCSLGGMRESKAATYNFYFNNTEQGDNSTAAPTVTVQDGKADAPANTATATSTSTGTEEEQAPEEGSVVAHIPALEQKFPDAHWKFSLGSIQTTYDSGESSFYGEQKETRTGRFIGSLTFFPVREVGVGFHVGRFIGPELEYNPFGVKTGWGKIQFGLTAALFLDREGYDADSTDEFSSFTASAAVNGNFEPQPMPIRTIERKRPLNAYFGAQAGVNIIRDVALNIAYRIAPLERFDRVTSTVHTSLNYLF